MTAAPVRHQRRPAAPPPAGSPGGRTCCATAPAPGTQVSSPPGAGAAGRLLRSALDFIPGWEARKRSDDGDLEGSKRFFFVKFTLVMHG